MWCIVPERDDVKGVKPAKSICWNGIPPISKQGGDFKGSPKKLRPHKWDNYILGFLAGMVAGFLAFVAKPDLFLCMLSRWG